MERWVKPSGDHRQLHFAVLSRCSRARATPCWCVDRSEEDGAQPPAALVDHGEARAGNEREDEAGEEAERVAEGLRAQPVGGEDATRGKSKSGAQRSDGLPQPR